jgi:hypothetical protein
MPSAKGTGAETRSETWPPSCDLRSCFGELGQIETKKGARKHAEKASSDFERSLHTWRKDDSGAWPAGLERKCAQACR